MKLALASYANLPHGPFAFGLLSQPDQGQMEMPIIKTSLKAFSSGASPWKLALPALIIGPVTYLVTVAILFWRHS